MEYIKIISGVLAIFIGYHKFILSLLDRKIDKEGGREKGKERSEKEERGGRESSTKKKEEAVLPSLTSHSILAVKSLLNVFSPFLLFN